MCYNVVSATRKLITYAKHRGDDPAYIARLEKLLEKFMGNLNQNYFVSGFSHPKLLVFTNQEPNVPKAITWGLIPSWVRTEEEAMKIWNHTLNARSESIFEKPSFKNSAMSKRCIIYLDAFYEYHHQSGKTFPFHISDKNDAPLAIAGLWDEWVNPQSGEIIQTCTIVTTKGNDIMQKIHNNPKMEEARMPVILNKEEQDLWLNYEYPKDEEAINALFHPLSSENLKYYPVQKLTGKGSLGNKPEVEKPLEYAELKITL